MKILKPALLLTLVSSSCATAPRSMEGPAEAAALRVHRAVEQSTATSDHAEVLRVEARFNPVPCDAPPWELRLRGTWTRAALRAGRDMSEEASVLLMEDDITEGSVVWLRLSPTARSEAGADGLRFRVMELIDLGD